MVIKMTPKVAVSFRLQEGNAYTFLASGSYVSGQGSLGQCFLLGFCNRMHTQIRKPPLFFIISCEKGRGESLDESGGVSVLSFLRSGARKRRL